MIVVEGVSKTYADGQPAALSGDLTLEMPGRWSRAPLSHHRQGTRPDSR